jgi:hypothetical protein
MLSADLGAVYILLTVSLNWVLRIILKHKREDREDCIMIFFFSKYYKGGEVLEDGKGRNCNMCKEDKKGMKSFGW